MGTGRKGVRIEDKDEHSECYHVGVPSMGWTMYSQFQPLELGTLKLKFHHHWEKKSTKLLLLAIKCYPLSSTWYVSYLI